VYANAKHHMLITTFCLLISTKIW